MPQPQRRLREAAGARSRAGLRLRSPLGVPFVIVPLVNADNNQHSFDENLRMGSFVSGMRTTLGLLLTDYGE